MERERERLRESKRTLVEYSWFLGLFNIMESQSYGLII